MIQSNMSDGYALIVASEQRVELFSRIGTLEQDNMRLIGMLGVERQRVDRLRRSMSHLGYWYNQKYPVGNGKYSHRFYNKPVKDNKLLLHDLGNHDHQKNYADVRRKPLEFQVGGISVKRSDTFWQTEKAEP
ncbi:hypothetical protein Tco_0770259 [Tanacetum coccineum]|uniref:Uncharacterized protein n=1 Tax=Tanacetum coccineum TaxID=301880 RepID=A0ABQ4ZFK4_9ASTR